MNLSNECTNLSYARSAVINPNFQFVLKMLVKCIWHECTLTDVKRVDMAQTRERHSLHRSTWSSMSRPSWRWHLGLSHEEIRWNRTDGLILSKPLRVVPGRLVLENDGATSRSNWPAELRSGRQGPTMTILLIADRTWRPAWDRFSSRTTGWRSLKWPSYKCAIVFQRCTFTQRLRAFNCEHFALGSIIWLINLDPHEDNERSLYYACLKVLASLSLHCSCNMHIRFIM